MTNLRILLISGVLWLSASVTFAQQTTSARHDVCGSLAPNDDPPGQLRFVIRGQPYSAVQESEFSQTLADGTHIDRKTAQGHEYRDSEGRTRREHSPIIMGGIGPRTTPLTVDITDPVELKQFFLDTQNQIARVHTASYLADRTTGSKSRTRSTTIQSLAPSNRPRPEVTSEDLGTQVMEGLEVRGTRITTTYPVDYEGNDRPISRSRETWCSSELHAVIMTKMDNPESGTTVMRLTDIDRSEPDPALFQVPPGYTIEEQPLRPIGRSGPGTATVISPR